MRLTISSCKSADRDMSITTLSSTRIIGTMLLMFACAPIATPQKSGSATLRMPVGSFQRS